MSLFPMIPMSKRRSTSDLLRAMITFIRESGEYEFAKSDFRNPPCKIDPESVPELWEIAKLVQDEFPSIKEIIEIKGKHFLRLHDKKKEE